MQAVLSIRASGGQWSARAAVKPSSPPTSRTSTPSPSLQTSPQRACARASCQTKGGNRPLHFTANADLHPVHALTYGPAPYGDVSRYSSAQVCCGQRTRGRASGTLPCRPGRSRGGSRDRTCWLRLFRHDVQSGAAMADHRAHHHLHRPVRAGDDAGFAADATLLHHMDKAFIAADGAVRADIGAGASSH